MFQVCTAAPAAPLPPTSVASLMISWTLRCHWTTQFDGNVGLFSLRFLASIHSFRYSPKKHKGFALIPTISCEKTDATWTQVEIHSAVLHLFHLVPPNLNARFCSMFCMFLLERFDLMVSGSFRTRKEVLCAAAGSTIYLLVAGHVCMSLDSIAKATFYMQSKSMTDYRCGRKKTRLPPVMSVYF